MTPKAEVVRPEENLVGMLEHLYLQINNFPAMQQFAKTFGYSTAVMFLPQTLQQIDAEINRNSVLGYECYEYLDMVSMFSISVYGSDSAYYKQILNAIINNRHVNTFDNALGESTTTHIVTLSGEEMSELLNTNKYLVALYIYCLINKITYNR